MSKALLCPHCRHDVSLTGHPVELDGEELQNGGCCTIAWKENCPVCDEEFMLNVILGPVVVSVEEVQS